MDTEQDLEARVVAMAPAVDRARVHWAARAALAAAAVAELVLALPLLVGLETGGDPHLARHAGAFALAYALGLGTVALRPAKARAMAPVTVALAIAMAVSAVADVVQGRTPAMGELSHAPEILGLGLVWYIASRRHRIVEPEPPSNVTRLPTERRKAPLRG